MAIRHLLTTRGEELLSSGSLPWNEYPRPQMKRPDWMCLNGKWDFCACGDSALPSCYPQEILVPFCPESLLSGVNRTFDAGTFFYYRRRFSVPEEWSGKHILLHFGAVDQLAEVFVNGASVITHAGGYLPFYADITGFLTEGENELVVKAYDDLSHILPWGKQVRERGGIWYTPVSGIWQTVWLEPVPEKHIEKVDVRVDENRVRIRVSGIERGILELEGKKYEISDSCVRVFIEEPSFWSPENPKLYPFSVVSGADRVESYFALRTLSVKNVKGVQRLCLNGEPYFFNGLLDQGYFSDGIYTPASPECYTDDITAMKALGYNTLRKHIKIEPERFYYDCDRLGMVVFQDMVNNGEYNKILESGLSLAGFTGLPDRFLNRNEKAREYFLEHMEATYRHLDAHPCICYWTVFNEGWGQFCADSVYWKMKKLDPTRFVDATSGWFHQKYSDVDSMHIYIKKLRRGKMKLPLVLSEFGGYCCKYPGHSENLEKTFGYRQCAGHDAFLADFRELYEKQLLPLYEKGLCAAIYTQVSDVEDETNGLLTYDRKVCKLSPEETLPILEKFR